MTSPSRSFLEGARDNLRQQERIWEELPVGSFSRITPVYFTTGKHFEMLYLSLTSLQILGSSHIGNVWIYCDADDPWTGRQAERLLQLDLRIHLCDAAYGCNWGGLRQIMTELTAMKQLSRTEGDGYLMKVDSDVVFLNNSLFDQVMRGRFKVLANKPGLYGFHDNRMKYIQGGCFFISNSCMRSLDVDKVETTTKSIKEDSPFSSGDDNMPVDYWFTRYLHENGVSPRFREYYYCLQFLPLDLPSKSCSVLHVEGGLLQEVLSLPYSLRFEEYRSSLGEDLEDIRVKIMVDAVDAL